MAGTTTPTPCPPGRGHGTGPPRCSRSRSTSQTAYPTARAIPPAQKNGHPRCPLKLTLAHRNVQRQIEVRAPAVAVGTTGCLDGDLCLGLRGHGIVDGSPPRVRVGESRIAEVRPGERVREPDERTDVL